MTEKHFHGAYVSQNTIYNVDAGFTFCFKGFSESFKDICDKTGIEVHV